MIEITSVLLLASCFLQVCSPHEVCIAPDDGSQKSPSYCESTTTINDFCLHANDSDISNTVVTVLNGTHMLNRTCEFHHVNNLTLRGQSQSKPVVQCFHYLGNAGFIFRNVSMARISAMEFTGCGAHLIFENCVIYNPSNRLAALLFVNGSDLTLTNVTVSDSKSIGIYIRNAVGNVTIDSCSIMALGSSVCYGQIVEYYPSLSKHANLTIIDTLIRISNRGASESKCDDESRGLYLYLSSSKVSATIERTNFIDNFCGNMAVAFHAFASVTVSNSFFNNGGVDDTGGILVLFRNSKDPDSYKNNFPKVLSIINSTYISNSGGAVYIEWEQSLSQTNRSAYIDITNSIFDGNGASTGPVAVGIAGHENSKFQVVLNISGCTFSNHILQSIIGNEQPRQPVSELSVIAATDAPYLVLDSITVHSNLCTAILARESTIAFFGSSRIFNNSAVSGGGLGLVNSVMILTPSMDLIITNNSAQWTGGGIQLYEYYTRIVNIVYYGKCFYQVNPEIQANPQLWNTVNFSVFNNHAEEGGDNIFGSISSYCHRSRDDSKPCFPANNASHPSSLASTAKTVCFNKEWNSGCNRAYAQKTFPGQIIELFLRVIDESSGSVSGIVMATTIGGVVLDEAEKTHEVGVSGNKITFTVFSSQPPTVGQIKLSIWSYTLDTYTATVYISFTDCPFGFKNTSIGEYRMFRCQCNLNPVIDSCSLESQILTKKQYSWIGILDVHNNSFLATTEYCPLDYCKPDFQDIKSYPDYLDQDEQCQYNRTGILCGSCPEGWSLVLGSSECREKCSNVWLLLILPFALAGLLLVAVIHFLNLTVTIGTVCGLIFYANIVQDYSVALLSTHPIPGLTPILQVFLSWLNLDLGIPTCLYDGMGAFGKTMFLSIFPVYIQLISATIIIFSNRYIYFTRLVGENSVKVLATLFLLSYSKMLRVTIGSLRYKIVSIITNESTITNVRWIIDGNIPYFDLQKHLTLFVISIVCIMFLFPFTMSLLCIRHVYSLSNCCRIFSWIDKLKPFFDTYTGPFKDKARFWTGLLLLVRLFLLIVNAVDYKDSVIPYYIIIAVCQFLMSAMLILRGVYKKRGLDNLEYFFIVNICILFLINSYKGGPDSWKSISSHLLVSSAFLVFLGIVSYHVYLKLSHQGFLRRMQLRPQNADVDDDRLSFDGIRDDAGLNAEDTPLIQPIISDTY